MEGGEKGKFLDVFDTIEEVFGATEKADSHSRKAIVSTRRRTVSLGR